MPSDPNARRDKALSDITQALTKTNRLLEAQNKILEKMERHARPVKFTNHPYLVQEGSESAGTPEYEGPYGSGSHSGR
jgi:hypothetical protein